MLIVAPHASPNFISTGVERFPGVQNAAAEPALGTAPNRPECEVKKPKRYKSEGIQTMPETQT